MYMDISSVVVRPAPQFEHPGRWATACECGDGAERPHATRPPAPGRLRAVPTADRRAADTAADRRAADTASASAREFVIAAMTVVLEVVDRRRPVTALRPLVAAPVVDHVLSRGRARHESRTAPGPAARTAAAGLRLRRVHIQFVGDCAAEFFGSYTCGRRVRAFAGRMAVTKAACWQMQGLMLD